jgi:hypothetical protein
MRHALLVLASSLLASGCACGASSHELDGGGDVPSIDAPVDLDVPTDTGLDGGGCWRHCSFSGSSVSGTVTLDGVTVPIARAQVHSSYAFAVYLQIELYDHDACDGTPTIRVLLDDGDPETVPMTDPAIGTNVVQVSSDTSGMTGLGTMDVSAWAPSREPTPDGRLAARLVASLPWIELDLAIDVTPCLDESGP